MYPLERMTSPEPTPPAAKIVTTEGSSWPATEITLHDEGEGDDDPATVVGVVVAFEGELAALAISAPATAAAISTTTPAAIGMARRRRGSPGEDITDGSRGHDTGRTRRDAKA